MKSTTRALLSMEAVFVCLLVVQLWTRMFPTAVYFAVAGGLAVAVALLLQDSPQLCLSQAVLVAALSSQIYFIGTHYQVLPGGDEYGQFAVLSIFDRFNRAVPISLVPPPPGALDPSFYSGWPGLQLLTLMIARLAGLDIFTAAIWVPQLLYAIWLGLAYLVFLRLVDRFNAPTWTVALALLLFVTFPFAQPIPIFKYQNFAFVFWLAIVYLGLSERRMAHRRIEYLILIGLALLASAVAHNLGFVIVLVWLIGVGVWQLWANLRSRPAASGVAPWAGLATVIVLGGGIFVGWAVFYPTQSATFLSYGRAVARNSAISVTTLRLQERERPLVGEQPHAAPPAVPLLLTYPPVVYRPFPDVPAIPLPPPLAPSVLTVPAGHGRGVFGPVSEIVAKIARYVIPNMLQFTIPLTALTPGWLKILLALRLVFFALLTAAGFLLVLRLRRSAPTGPLFVSTGILALVAVVSLLAGDTGTTFRVFSYAMPFAAVFAALMLGRIPRHAVVLSALAALFVFASLTGLNANRFAYMHLFGPEVSFQEAGEHAPQWRPLADFLPGRLDFLSVRHYASDEIYTAALLLPVTEWSKVAGIVYPDLDLGAAGTVVVAVNRFNYVSVNEQLRWYFDPQFDPARFQLALTRKALIYSDGTFILWR